MYPFTFLQRLSRKYKRPHSTSEFSRSWSTLIIPIVACIGTACVQDSTSPPITSLGETPGIVRHVSNDDVLQGTLSTEELLQIGHDIFTASLNTLDGSGNSKTRLLQETTDQAALLSGFNRISGPDANACSGCHNMPTTGGGGDNVSNVFGLAHRLPDVNFDAGAGDLLESLTLRTVGNERGTISMFGSGLIELLAREMTNELHAIKKAAVDKASVTGLPVTVAIETKGVSFGKITVWPDGLIDASKTEGIDEDLIVKPFGQKGVYTSLREFTLDALELHHGLQGEERVGSNNDADQDGVPNELTNADTTALTLFQASLPPPFMSEPTSRVLQSYVSRGQTLFSSIGCAVCHKPFLELKSPIYSEPNAFNPPGTLSTYAIPDSYRIDLSQNASPTTVRRTEQGTYLVYAFTDLKRHDMGPILANETIEQRFVESPVWLTRKLWGIMSEPPFLHHGRATLLEEAIAAHGGESESARLNYNGLSSDDKVALIEFLKTFQTSVLP